MLVGFRVAVSKHTIWGMKVFRPISSFILQICSLFIVSYYFVSSSPSNSIHSSSSLSSNVDKILVAIPGMGLHPNRTEIILSNLQYLFPSSNNQYKQQYELDCIIFVYKTLPKSLIQEISAVSPCILEYLYHGNYAYYTKALIPHLLHESGYSFLFILLDDVRLSEHFNLTQIILTMKANNLSMASPGITSTNDILSFDVGILRASMHSTLPHRHTFPPRARYVRIIEIFATVFTIPKWTCWWNMLQPGLNNAGWGYDLCLSHFCPDPVMRAYDRENHTRFDSINSFVTSYAVIGSQRLIHEKFLGRLHVNISGLADQYLANLPPGKQKALWLETLSLKQNNNRPISCLDRERNHQGKSLEVVW